VSGIKKQKAEVILHSFSMGDVEDVEIYAAEPIYQWQQTPEGKWAMEHAENIYWISRPDALSFGHRIEIIGTLSDKYATYYSLKNS